MIQKYPIGIQSFASLREGGYAYVDKTEVIYRLITTGKYYFLSRPRRFGKSLLLSTIKELFEGRRELFEGLYICSTDFDWQPRPVVHLDFASTDVSGIEGLKIHLDFQLTRYEMTFGISHEGLDYSSRFYNILKTACEKTGRRVVVLIDEYDKMLVNNLHNPTLHEEIKAVLRPVYANLKSADDYIHFGMLTGVSRFSKLSVFSDLNNLQDITLDESFATICGITEEEIRANFASGVEIFAASEKIDSERVMQILKENYDGYHFSKQCPDIYNPFSLLHALKEQAVRPYWFASGTPTFLVRMIQNSGIDLRNIFTTYATEVELSSGEAMGTNLKAVLFQTGYLTIKSYDSELEVYQLTIPNREVERGIFDSLLPCYAGREKELANDTMLRLKMAVRDGDAEQLMHLLQSFLADIPYDLTRKKPEIYFENNLYIIFRLLGFYVATEYRTSQGRIDIVMHSPRFTYIMELKLNGTPQEALEQIDERNYAAPFASDARQIIKIGVNFSSATRNIDNWLIER